MKILLINDNPVVGKLVTLSAQKTGDELIAVGSAEEATLDSYDLVIVDDTSYNKEEFDGLIGRASVVQSCFIGSRSSERPEGFSRELNKPFLPTDLVDIFSQISSKEEIESVELEEELVSGLEELDVIDDIEAGIDEEDVAMHESLDELADLDELDELGELEELEEVQTDAVSELEDLDDVALSLDDADLGIDELSETQSADLPEGV